MSGFYPYRDSEARKVEYPPKGFGFVYHADFPERFVREKSDRGWMTCDTCDASFKLWMTRYQNWELLPEEIREAFLCTRCFRKIVELAGRSDPEAHHTLRKIVSMLHTLGR